MFSLFSAMSLKRYEHFAKNYQETKKPIFFAIEYID